MMRVWPVPRRVGLGVLAGACALVAAAVPVVTSIDLPRSSASHVQAPYGGTVTVNTEPGEESCDLTTAPRPELSGARTYYAIVTGRSAAEVVVLDEQGAPSFAWGGLGNSGAGGQPTDKTLMGLEKTLAAGTYRARCIIGGRTIISEQQLTIRS